MKQAALIMLLLALAGCGKKAAMMEPAGDVDPAVYPHTYPDSHSDPAGTYTHDKN